MLDVIVIGGGALGHAIAYNLKKAGADFKLIDANYNEVHSRYPVTDLNFPGKTSATFAAGGMLNIFAEVDAVTTFSHPLYIERFETALKAKPYWKELAKELKFHVRYGTYVITGQEATDLDYENHIKIMQALKHYNEPHDYGKPNGYAYDNDAVLFLQEEGWIDPMDYIKALNKTIRADEPKPKGRSPGVTWNKDAVFYNSHAHVTKNGPNDFTVTVWGNDMGSLKLQTRQVVIATGSDDHYIKTLGAKTQKLFHGVGHAWTIHNEHVKIDKVIRSTNRNNACGVTVVPRCSNTYYVGASYEEADEKTIYDALYPSMGNHYYLIKQLCEDINPDFIKSKIWASHTGCRPCTEDGLPLIGPTSVPGLYVATGTRRDGLFMSPMIGEYMTELLAGGPNRFPESWLPEREPYDVLDKQAIADKYQTAFQQTHKF